ncbi:MAG: diguanylate cyclase, partial [Spirochaetota bacterium]
DTYGHQAGDEVLRVVARLLSESGRGSDLQCRFGGEEFVLVMPGMSTAQARERMEGLQMVLAGSPIANGDSLISITFSAGIAAAPANGQDMDALIKCADEALYQSKSAGRNRVTCFGTAPIIDIPAIFAP